MTSLVLNRQIGRLRPIPFLTGIFRVVLVHLKNKFPKVISFFVTCQLIEVWGRRIGNKWQNERKEIPIHPPGVCLTAADDAGVERVTHESRKGQETRSSSWTVKLSEEFSSFFSHLWFDCLELTGKCGMFVDLIKIQKSRYCFFSWGNDGTEGKTDLYLSIGWKY